MKADSDGWLRRKIANGPGGFGNQKVWEFVHRRVWEDAYGPVPEGNAIAFKDGHRSNVAIENLELVSRADLMRRNTIHNRYPAELRNIIMLLGALKRRIRRREKENGKELDGRPAQSSVRDDRGAEGRREAA